MEWFHHSKNKSLICEQARVLDPSGEQGFALRTRLAFSHASVYNLKKLEVILPSRVNPILKKEKTVKKVKLLFDLFFEAF